MEKLHKHHTVNFDSIEKIDWHLKMLWSGGYQTIRDLDIETHRAHEAKKDNLRRKTKSKYWEISAGGLKLPHRRLVSAYDGR